MFCIITKLLFLLFCYAYIFDIKTINMYPLQNLKDNKMLKDNADHDEPDLTKGLSDDEIESALRDLTLDDLRALNKFIEDAKVNGIENSLGTYDSSNKPSRSLEKKRKADHPKKEKPSKVKGTNNNEASSCDQCEQNEDDDFEDIPGDEECDSCADALRSEGACSEKTHITHNCGECDDEESEIKPAKKQKCQKEGRSEHKSKNCEEDENEEEIEEDIPTQHSTKHGGKHCSKLNNNDNESENEVKAPSKAKQMKKNKKDKAYNIEEEKEDGNDSDNAANLSANSKNFGLNKYSFVANTHLNSTPLHRAPLTHASYIKKPDVPYVYKSTALADKKIEAQNDLDAAWQHQEEQYKKLKAEMENNDFESYNTNNQQNGNQRKNRHEDNRNLQQHGTNGCNNNWQNSNLIQSKVQQGTLKALAELVPRDKVHTGPYTHESLSQPAAEIQDVNLSVRQLRNIPKIALDGKASDYAEMQNAAISKMEREYQEKDFKQNTERLENFAALKAMGDFRKQQASNAFNIMTNRPIVNMLHPMYANPMAEKSTLKEAEESFLESNAHNPPRYVIKLNNGFIQSENGDYLQALNGEQLTSDAINFEQLKNSNQASPMLVRVRANKQENLADTLNDISEDYLKQLEDSFPRDQGREETDVDSFKVFREHIRVKRQEEALI